MRVEVLLTPAEIAALPGRDLSDCVCVVFDVLRATSTMLTALAHGAQRIFPVATVDEALEFRRDQCPGALLGGERGGVRIPGFDLGNSPLEYTANAVAARDLIMTTTNGTVALRACAGAATVYAGSLLNLAALAAAIRNARPAPPSVLLVCAGTGEHFALEDGYAAAALLSLLPETSQPTDAAQLLGVLYREHGLQPCEVLKSSSNGRRLLALGMANDIDHCARVSVLDLVGVLQDGALIATDGTKSVPG